MLFSIVAVQIYIPTNQPVPLAVSVHNPGCWFIAGSWQRRPVMTAVLGLFSSVAKAAGFVCRVGYWEPRLLRCVAATGSPCFSSLFWAISVCLSFAGLRVGWKQGGTFMQCPERLRKLVAHPALPSPAKGTLSSWEVPSCCWAMQLGRWDDTGKTKLSSFPFWAVILKPFVPLCCWNFLSGPQSSLKALFVCG